jgi:hypothetical protein
MKMQDWKKTDKKVMNSRKMQDWKMTDKIGGLENAGLENDRQNKRTGKWRSGK